MTYILFYVIAKDCPACKTFGVHWEGIQASLKKALGDRLEIETISYEKRTAAALDTAKYPIDLMRFISWYPTFVLVPKDAYVEAKARTRPLLPAVVFNGRMPPEVGARVLPVQGKDRLPLNGTSLQAWVERETVPAPAPPVPLSLPVDDQEVCTRLRLVSRFTRPPA